MSVFAVILVRISPHSDWIRENADQNNSEYGQFFHRVLYHHFEIEWFFSVRFWLCILAFSLNTKKPRDAKLGGRMSVVLTENSFENLYIFYSFKVLYAWNYQDCEGTKWPVFAKYGIITWTNKFLFIFENSNVIACFQVTNKN